MIKTVLLSLFALAAFFLPFDSVKAQSSNFGLDQTAQTAFGQGSTYVNSQATVAGLAGNIIGTVLSLVGLIFFILMIYAGILWMTARGDSGTTEKAKETIIASVVGIVIVLASYAITNFVFQSVDGSSNPVPTVNTPPQ